MKLTTDQIIDTSLAEAVEKFCAKHFLSTVEPEPTIEQLIERHKITVRFLGLGTWRADVGMLPDLKSTYGISAAGAVNELVARIKRDEERKRTPTDHLLRKYGITLSVDMFGIWTATTPSGFHSYRCDTAKDAVEMAAAQAERDAEHKAQKERAKATAEANAFGFEKGGYVSGGYVTQKPGASFEQAPAPAKKPAEIIEDAKDSARKAITRGIEATMARYHEATGEHITEVCPLIRTLNLPGSDGVMAKRRSALDSVRLSTG